MSYMSYINTIYNKCSQGIIVGICTSITFINLIYMIDDSHNTDKKRIIKYYELKIKNMDNERSIYDLPLNIPVLLKIAIEKSDR